MFNISRFIGIPHLFLGALVLGSSCATLAQAQPAAFCADSEQTQQISTAFANENPPALHQAATRLSMPEAMIASALGSERAHGVAGRHFAQIWKMLEVWETAVVVVMKGGHVFETHGRIQSGEPSKRSNFFNLHGHQDGLSGHLRPDLVSAIYAINLPGKNETLRGVLFYDMQGDIAFGVYVPGEGAKPPASLISQFESTRKEISALPSVCD